MNAAHRLWGMLAAAALLASAVGSVVAFAASPDDPASYEIRLRQFDLFGYHSGDTDRDRSQVQEALSRSYGGIWNVYYWNPQSRTPSEMYGSGAEIAGPLRSSDDVRGAAERIIQANPETFRAELNGLRFTGALNAPAVTNRPDGVNRPAKWAAHFQQVYEGVDVDGGRST